MLQQTTVAAVIPYYERFLTAFPDVQALATGDEQQVLRLWEGLGYYSRARNLHRAAKQIVAEHDSRLPADVATLQTLPGIGRYTAGAIASLGHDRPAPIVEANTLRLYCRLLAFEGDPRSKTGQQLLWQFAEAIVPRTSPGAFNQALIDLGATVCTPQAPRCTECPVMTLCGARQAGREQELPRPAVRPELTDVTECAVIVRRRSEVLLRRCQPGERWAGLWDFPRFRVEDVGQTPREAAGQKQRRTKADARDDLPADLAREAVRRVEALTGLQITPRTVLHELRHGVTRYRIRLICLEAECESASRQLDAAVLRWMRPADLSSLPLSTTGRIIAERLLETP